MRINEEIRNPSVFLIGPNGEAFGRISNDQAQFLAFDANLDLVELNPNADPPVVKIMDFGKYRYELERKEREARSKSKAQEMKEVRLSRKIDTHDLETKGKRVKEWLERGNKVRIQLRLIGREGMFAESARQSIDEFVANVGGHYEQAPNRMGNRIIAIIGKSK